MKDKLPELNRYKSIAAYRRPMQHIAKSGCRRACKAEPCRSKSGAFPRAVSQAPLMMTLGYQVFAGRSICVSFVLAPERTKAPIFRPRLFVKCL